MSILDKDITKLQELGLKYAKRSCRKLKIPVHHAEDLVQIALIALCKKKNLHTPYWAWFRTVVRFQALKLQRKLTREDKWLRFAHERQTRAGNS